MSAFKHSSTCALHSAVAIGISCTQSLGVDFSPATPRGALVGIVCSVCRVHARTVREKTRTGLGGRVHMSIQGGNMIISIMSISLRITFKPVRYHSKMSKQSAQHISWQHTWPLDRRDSVHHESWPFLRDPFALDSACTRTAVPHA